TFRSQGGKVTIYPGSPIPPRDESGKSPLTARLARPINLPGPGEKVPVRDALAVLSDRAGQLPILIARHAFERAEEGAPPSEERMVKLPKASKVALGQVLQQVLDQVDAAYVVLNDHLRVVPRLRKKGKAAPGA